MEYEVCEICGDPREPGTIRCSKCHTAWTVGYNEGYDIARREIRSALEDFVYYGEDKEDD